MFDGSVCSGSWSLLSLFFLYFCGVSLFVVFVDLGSVWFFRMSVVFSFLIRMYARLAGDKAAFGFKHYLDSLCLTVLFLNFGGLVPGVVGWTGQLVFPFLLALSSWSCIVLMALFYKFSSFIASLTPEGVPLQIAFMMVWVELFSNLVRPLTLGMRLLANMVAGHIMLYLCAVMVTSSAMSISFFVLVFMVFVLFGFSLFESMVCFLQSYIFGLLVGMYAKETE